MDLDEVARAIIDGNRYMVLGTADEGGRPWVSPVYYAPSGYSELYWVSSPEAQHSRNLAARRDLSIVVFDSEAPVGEGQGVYCRPSPSSSPVPTSNGASRSSPACPSRTARGRGPSRTSRSRRRCVCTGHAYPSTGCSTRSAGPISGRASGRSEATEPSSLEEDRPTTRSSGSTILLAVMSRSLINHVFAHMSRRRCG